jgi:deoxyribonuclease V
VIADAPWPRTAAELAAVQARLAAARPQPWRGPAEESALGGCFVCFPRGKSGAGDAGDAAWAAAAVVQGGRVLAEASVRGAAGAPYEPGALALREGQVLEAAVRALARRPDVLLVDASGRDHPRRAGLALHLGAVLNLPTVGVTHRPLAAQGEWPELRRGARAPLFLDGEVVGAWLCTRAGRRPLAVHPGWGTDIDAAVAVVLAACRRVRAPEPLRRARRLARVDRAGAGGQFSDGSAGMRASSA